MIKLLRTFVPGVLQAFSDIYFCKQDLTDAHGRYLDSIAKTLEANYAADKEAACKLIREEEAKKRQDLESHFKKKQAETAAEHEAAIAEAEAMQARRISDSKQFTFIVRGCKGELASGSVPRQVFQAEPNSALAHIYNGEWEYAQDREGRALVNSNPLHWPLILDWLSFGAIPEHPSKAFISECTFWQLDKLIAAMQPQQGAEGSLIEATGKEGYRFSVSKTIMGGKHGFTLKGTIYNFAQRFQHAEGLL